jgi:hypothetical protein
MESIFLWNIFVQTIHEPQGDKMQEGAKKDVERCFRVFQAHFAIIQNPSRQMGHGHNQKYFHM